MKLLHRNLRPIYYCLYDRTTVMHDEEGYENGDKSTSYFAPVELLCNVSPAKGAAQIETFGNLENYDRVIITDNMDCPIDENTVLFVDKPAQWEGGTVIGYDYKVIRVAKSFNTISIAISKVDAE